jgi:thioester reductase-like protein
LTSKLKQYSYVSTIGVATGMPLATFAEDTDIRVLSRHAPSTMAGLLHR